MKSLSRVILLIALLWANAANAEIFKQAGDLYAAMQQARSITDFGGVLVYSQGGNDIQSVRVSHRLVAGIEQERLVALDGMPREILRIGDRVICLFPDGKQLLLGREGTNQLDPLQRVRPELINENYQLRYAGTSRYAGWSAEKYMVIPVDSWRFGYLVWIERSSNLMLKIQTLDQQGQVLEQLRFGELDLAPQFTDAEFTLPEVESFMAGPAPVSPLQHLDTWWPPGFSRRPEPFESAALQYHDGLAMISLFLDPDMPAGSMRKGATGALSQVRTIAGQAQAVTLVGEVPDQTLQAIMRALGDPQ